MHLRLAFFATALGVFAKTLRGGRRLDQVGDDVEGNSRDQAGVVSLSGDGKRMAVGAPFFDVPPEGPQNPNLPKPRDHGSVTVYELDGGDWVPVGDPVLGEFAGEERGYAVALNEDGAVLAVGGFGPQCFESTDGANCRDENPGFVRLYELDGGAWKQLGDTILGETAGDRFGSALALSDDGRTVAAGAPIATEASGNVRVFALESGKWEQLGVDVDGEAEGGRAGFAVDLNADGRVLAIGARFSPGGEAEFAGLARVYEFRDDDWQQLGGDIDGQNPLEKAGRSVALSEDGLRVAVGAVGARNEDGAVAGNVRVYEFRGGAWGQVGDDMDGLLEDDQAGTTVDISADGNVVAMGAPGHDPGGAGLVRTFAYDGARNWYELEDITDGARQGDAFGASLSLAHDGRTLAAGSLAADGAAGVARVFEVPEPFDRTPVPSPKPTPEPTEGADETPRPTPEPTDRPVSPPTPVPAPTDGGKKSKKSDGIPWWVWLIVALLILLLCCCCIAAYLYFAREEEEEYEEKEIEIDVDDVDEQTAAAASTYESTSQEIVPRDDQSYASRGSRGSRGDRSAATYDKQSLERLTEAHAM